MPTPVSALCPSASEKNAMRPDTAIVPISASAGAISTTATSATFMNPYWHHSNGNAFRNSVMLRRPLSCRTRL